MEDRRAPAPPAPSPEQLELEAKWEEIGRLREEVVECERSLLTYLWSLQAFEHDHVLRCGRRYFELDSLEAEIQELLAAQAPDDEVQQERAVAARARARKLLEETREHEAHGPAEPVDITDELKSLYRRAAREFHPDLAMDESEKKVRHDYMVELNAAYKRGDAERVKELMDDWRAHSGPRPDKGVAEQLVEAIRIIANLRGRIEKLGQERSDAEQSEMGLLHRDYLAAREDGRDLIAELLAQLDLRIQQARERVSDLRSE